MENFYDMIIVGGGPAGLSSAIYMARAKYKTLVIEQEKFGGQITLTSEIVNYPGVYNTSGTELTNTMKNQAEAFGAEFKLSKVTDIELDGDIKIIKTSNGEYKALSVILALGASPRKLGFDGETEFQGRGVAYCATCDGEFFTDKPIYVVGGGFAAVEEAIFLTKYASNIQMIVRGDDFSCAKTISDHLQTQPKISVNFNTEVVSVSGDNTLNSITLLDKKTGETRTDVHENGFGVFVFAGYIPNTNWISDKIELENGYIVTDSSKQTNVAGVYGAGDVCIKDLRQVVTAVSDGAKASTASEKYIASMHKKLNLPDFEIKKSNKTHNAPENHSSHESSNTSDSFIDEQMREQLTGIFSKFSSKITINAVVDNSSLAQEMSSLADEITGISSNVLCKKTNSSQDELAPYIDILREDNSSSGIKFYAMPGGHEFNSFILSMYNVAGPGKEVLEQDHARILNITQKIDIKILISLSCTMCPDLVVASGRISSLNKNITTNILDIAHFPKIKEKFNVMSVPCMIINDEIVHFGKKDITQILDILEQL